ncbi:MAG: hypothetical protein Q7Q73_08060 [Verrucomicrobiota bacterium JB024]|nr:hypothetical protein [Verrucomicrobiota bacterium JB024]
MDTPSPLSATTWAAALARRYPRLPAERTTFRDGIYRPVPRADALSLHMEFLAWMRTILEPHGVFGWVKDKGDCDFWSRLFIAYVLLRNVIGQAPNKPALAEIHFLKTPADSRSGHSVCSLLDERMRVYELDPQPGCGLTRLTDAQAATCRSLDA